MNVFVQIQTHDKIEVCFDPKHKTLISIRAKGCLRLLTLVEQYRKEIGTALDLLPMPIGDQHHHMLMREALLKAKKEWDFPYKEEELCHCRKVPTAVVDTSILQGAHTVEQVGKETSAGTACGSCRPHTQKIIDYRKTHT